MGIEAYIKEKQPLVYRTFHNALENGRLSHAYLLYGERGIPLKETAIYLAKSILCEHGNPFADLSCNICKRIDAGEYLDFVLLDGAESAISKDDVSSLMGNFSQTAIEKRGIMVYVINEVETMNVSSINSILKFLEEPSPNTYAILTTRNEAKVLPTIISRCEEIRMLLAPREEVEKEALALNVAKDDAEMLSFFVNDASFISDYAKDDDYQSAKKAVQLEVEAMAEGALEARYITEKEVTALVNSKKTARDFFDMMSLVFEDAASFKRGGIIRLQSMSQQIKAIASSLKDVDEALLQTMTLRTEIESNINLGLLLSHLIFAVYKEK